MDRSAKESASQSYLQNIITEFLWWNINMLIWLHVIEMAYEVTESSFSRDTITV
jgi:hypothetical protein